MARDPKPTDSKLSHTAAMILQALDAGFVYGFSIMEMTGLPSGTVYPAMRRLERDDLIRSQWEKQSIADAEQRPPRKYYKLTAAGKSTLEDLAQALPTAGAADSIGGGQNGMTPFPASGLGFLRHLCHCGLLRSASFLVPAGMRADWRREWHGELWQVQQSLAPQGTCSWQGEREMAAFCLGAFQDALCFRRSAPERKPSFAETSGSPTRCLLALLVTLAAAYAFAIWLPGVSAERGLWPREVNPNLVFIERETSSHKPGPSITPRQFRSWESRRQKYFDAFAFFSVTTGQVASQPQNVARSVSTTWHVARASANLFPLLGLTVHLTTPLLTDAMPEVILSERTWKTQFGADPHVSGTVVRFADRNVRIAGVAPDGSLTLPGRVDAWELVPDVRTKGSGLRLCRRASQRGRKGGDVGQSRSHHRQSAGWIGGRPPRHCRSKSGAPRP